MPDGKVQWFDPKTGEGRIVRSNRQYPTDVLDVEPAARHAGARVHFDIQRRDGTERAVRVRLRAGTRTSRLQRRFGDLTGASRSDAKGAAPFARPHPELGLALQRHPVEVAKQWAALMANGDLEEAMLLYAPGAVLRTDGEVLLGPARLHGYLGASPLLGSGKLPDVRTDDGTVILRWGRPEAGEGMAESHLVVSHGEISEQWIGTHRVAPRGAETEPEPAVHVLLGAGIGEAERDYAARKVAKMLGFVAEPVFSAFVQLSKAGDPARERPAIAECTIDLNGQPVRAYVAAHTLREAVDLLERRLRDQLEQVAGHRRALRRRGPASAEGEWRHGDAPTVRPPFFDRRPEERELIRRKTFAVESISADEAIFDLESLDYDFSLFVDATTGEDTVAHRLPDGGYGRMSVVTVPVLSVDDAIERLDLSSEPFLLFREETEGRGRVLYRRYDGNYGLIVPADE